jgi:hypothetical protein
VKCPQCNAPAKRADIRVLYCKRLVAMDTCERDRLEARIAALQSESRRLEESLAKANLSVQLARAELDAAVKGAKKRRFALQNTTFSRSPYKFLRRALLGSNSAAFQCRTVAFDAHHGIFFVARSDESGSSSNTTSTSTGGVVKISLWDASATEFVALHEGPLRAIATSPHGDGLVLTCGASDNKLKLSALTTSNSVLQTWPLAASPWSCSFHPHSFNHVLVGLASGLIAMYDLRASTNDPPCVVFESPQKSKYPIHSLYILNVEMSGHNDKDNERDNDKSDTIIVDTSENDTSLDNSPDHNITYDNEINHNNSNDNNNHNNSSDNHNHSNNCHFILIGATMEGPFALKISSSTHEILASWSSDFGYKGFACTSLALDPVNRCKMLASFRSVPPRDPSRHVVFELDSNSMNLELRMPLVEFKSEAKSGPHRTPFRSAIIARECVECFIPDEASNSGNCYQFDANSISHSVGGPIEVLPTNAGIPIIETCINRIIERTSSEDQEKAETTVCALLTSKHLYIYSTDSAYL